MKVTFFVGSVVGYVDNPSALLTRGLAHGLSLRGHDARVVEERRNAAYVHTLETVGAGAARHFHDAFSTIQHHTYEPRTGAPLLEWLTREVALIDVAVMVAGAGDELCRWLANLHRDGLVRAFLAWTPADAAPERLRALDVNLYDTVVAPFDIGDVGAPHRPILATAAGADVEAGLATALSPSLSASLADPIEAALSFERAVFPPALAR